MPETTVIFFKEEDGSAPAIAFVVQLEAEAQAKAFKRFELLKTEGYELRRPHCDFLEHGIYELRFRAKKVQYRFLYFFHGKNAAVICHGLTKKDKVPKSDIALAVERKKKFERNPSQYTLPSRSTQ